MVRWCGGAVVRWCGGAAVRGAPLPIIFVRLFSVLITQNFDPAHKIGWIKCSFLKSSQLRDVVHRIRAPYLFDFET